MEIDFIKNSKSIAQQLQLDCEFIEHKNIDGSDSIGAAQALNVKLNQIVKAIIVKSRKRTHYLLLIPGDKKIEWKKLENITQEKKFSFISKDEVVALTNFRIGGIPPFIGLSLSISTYIDQSNLQNKFIYGSGGTPFMGLKVDPQLLVEKGAIPVDIVK